MLLIINEIKLLFKYHELLLQLAGREIKSRYKQSILGYFWVIIQPLSQLLVMTFAFSVILKVQTFATGSIPYIIFLSVALLPWNLFVNSLNSASGSLVANAGLISKTYLPKSVFILATLIAKLVDFGFSLLVLILFFIWYQLPVLSSFLWIVPIFLLQNIFTLGLSYFLATANLIYRDIQYLLSLILMLWMYFTPIFYSIDNIPLKFRFIFQLNPMSVIVNAYRQVILAGGSPNYSSLLLCTIVSFLTLYLGVKSFKSAEPTLADHV